MQDDPPEDTDDEFFDDRYFEFYRRKRGWPDDDGHVIHREDMREEVWESNRFSNRFFSQLRFWCSFFPDLAFSQFQFWCRFLTDLAFSKLGILLFWPILLTSILMLYSFFL